MKYSNWHERMNEKHGDDFPAYVDECLNPDVRDFLNHQRDEYQKAVEADALDYRYEALLQRTEKAEAALEDGSPDKIALSFCRLGETINDLEGLAADDKLKLYEAALDGSKRKIADFKRQRPTLEKQEFIKYTQATALRLWIEDKDKSIRLSEMCERVYKIMCPIELEWGRDDLLPGEAVGIKPWLREVAPSHARKPGRPTKTNM